MCAEVHHSQEMLHSSHRELGQARSQEKVRQAARQPYHYMDRHKARIALAYAGSEHDQ